MDLAIRLLDKGAFSYPLAAAFFSYFAVSVDHVLYWGILRPRDVCFTKMFASPGLYSWRDASISAQVLVMVMGTTGAFSSPGRALLLLFVLAGPTTV